MDFIANDSHLNLFLHYGKPKIEDNVTRALMIMLSRPPAAGEMTRAFLRAVRAVDVDAPDRFRGDAQAFRKMLDLCLADHGTVTVTMQETSREADAEEDAGESDEQQPFVICLALTPYRDLAPGGKGGQRSRADAVVRIDLPDERPDELQKYSQLVITVETKIHHRTDWRQFTSHATHIKAEPDASVALAWKDLYEALQRRPEYLNTEPLVQDFDKFLARFPKLTGWTGIDADDLDVAAHSYRCDVKLQQLASQLVEGNDHLNEPERQRGGRDYTIRVKGPAHKAGNIGVAVWSSGELVLKVAVGWKTKEETSRWLDALEDPDRRGSVMAAVEDYLSTLHDEFDAAHLHLDTGYRMFKYPHTHWYPATQVHLDGDDLRQATVGAKVQGLFDRTRAIHPWRGRSPWLNESRIRQVMEELDGRSRKRLVDDFEDDGNVEKWRQYAVIGAHAKIPVDALIELSPDDQVQKLRAVQERQVNVLRAVVGEGD